MSVVISPLSNAFAGEASAVDCAKPLDASDVDAIHDGMARHAVLVFRDQALTDEQQLAFTRRFGDLERYDTPGHIRKREQERLGNGIADFSNLTRNGLLMTPDDRVWLFKLGDRSVALRQLVPPDHGRLFFAVRANSPCSRRRDRIRGHARRL